MEYFLSLLNFLSQLQTSSSIVHWLLENIVHLLDVLFHEKTGTWDVLYNWQQTFCLRSFVHWHFYIILGAYSCRIDLQSTVSWKCTQDILFCKSIQHEYATKMILKYQYTKLLKLQVCCQFHLLLLLMEDLILVLLARKKKEAEQLGARTVIEWILGNSDTKTLMIEIISSKLRCSDYMTRSVTAGTLKRNNTENKPCNEMQPDPTYDKSPNLIVSETFQQIGSTRFLVLFWLMLIWHTAFKIEIPVDCQAMVPTSS
uniref:Uncharacterized protein LOC105058696 n=1 Tax=Elaeis guineensis var. tenera TaxID=51953 RepID=A0A6J0PRX4_ELAGV|nr:uncharacterized protein LOC105058696 [Elaeis guineensis]